MRRRFILGIIICMGICLGLSPHAALAFSDLKGHWARMQVDHLQARGIVKGYPDGRFKPDNPITRAEFVTMLVNVMHKEEEAKKLARAASSFKDVPVGFWANGYIELARELGYAYGDGERFYPQRHITRQEAVVMLVNCLLRIGAEAEIPGEMSFADSAEVAEWAKRAVAWGVDYGLISGYPDGTFRPGRNLSRAEVAALMQEFLDITGQKHHFYGKLVDINLPLRQARFATSWGEEVFEIAEYVKVYRQGEKEPVTELVLPVEGYFDLNSAGKLAFFYLTEKESGEVIKVDLASIYGREARVDEDRVFVKLNEEEELPKEGGIANPAGSLDWTRRAMYADLLRKETGANGRGILIAVIDSGVDPGHPDLMQTEDGFVKLFDFIDLTDEGKVHLNYYGRAENGFITVDGRKVDVRGIENKDDYFIWGYLNAYSLPAAVRQELPGDKILVVAAAAKYAGYYDTLYIDTNGDGQINDEIGLKKYSEEYQVISLPAGSRPFNLVAAEVPGEKRYAVLGFDSLGHGTAVAGVAAASGAVKGIAPGAQIMAIKVMNSMGVAYLSQLEEALKRAADAGARIAVISMGQYSLSKEQKDYIRRIAGEMHYKYGMIICMAAGNQGPGLGTVAQTAAIGGVISVGAYVTPEMLAHDYGLAIEEPLIWYFSSAGPGSDGMATPLVVAPGSAYTTYPLWSGSPYKLVEGTSIAAPHVAGGAALLLQAMRDKLYRHDPVLVYHSLLAGTVELPGYQAAEQGFGAVNLYNSWRELKNKKERPQAYVMMQKDVRGEEGYGFYTREFIPGKLEIRLKSYVGETRSLAIGGLGTFMQPEQYSLKLAPYGERSFTMQYRIPDQPGLYSHFVVADDYETVGWDAFILQTVAVPYDLAAGEDKRLLVEGRLAAGGFKRYFIKVPEGMEELVLRLQVGEKGRARMHVVSPTGEHKVSNYAGVGEVATNSEVELSFASPEAGTWEVVVYSSLTLSYFGLRESSYTLEAELKGEVKEKEKRPYQYLVTAYRSPKAERAGTPLTLFFWHYNTKMPGDGMVLIDNRLYQITGGVVRK